MSKEQLKESAATLTIGELLSEKKVELQDLPTHDDVKVVSLVTVAASKSLKEHSYLLNLKRGGSWRYDWAKALLESGNDITMPRGFDRYGNRKSKVSIESPKKNSNL